MNETDELKVLSPHWVEDYIEYTREIRDWLT